MYCDDPGLARGLQGSCGGFARGLWGVCKEESGSDLRSTSSNYVIAAIATMKIQDLLNYEPQKLPRYEYYDEVPDSQALESSASTLVPSSQASTQSWDSRDGPRSTTPTPCDQPRSPSIQMPSTLIIRKPVPLTTRSDRIRIKTALFFGIKAKEIQEKLKYTERQIRFAKNSLATPQVHRRGRNPALDTPKQQRLKEWLLESPSRRRIAWRHIPYHESFLTELRGYGESAIKTGLKRAGKKGLDSLKKRFNGLLKELLNKPFQTKFELAEEHFHNHQFNLENLQHKHSKRPA
ncbi:hypothetical protein MBM_08925 [Drepanopeziza brunnea f. sp. 'multigermtubi' MB_m1]|uniref:Uncharacterized protein n=1 Tax=Marssonina brunnea f. sp. multigermtubi (strain MB_m1) TaxID=1072389 RepID=K1WJD4_MARBU|nr:uncharacterized protein MBM_08925 [Drepanopeziza brunnea f. sp. 'multigermtubi' MB_m1]EKD12971.1 hypothetical protein MBM_08925 [Drepanopeziza brunnea f. sp. 'multigermtubi' MB_m1]